MAASSTSQNLARLFSSSLSVFTPQPAYIVVPSGALGRTQLGSKEGLQPSALASPNRAFNTAEWIRGRMTREAPTAPPLLSRAAGVAARRRHRLQVEPVIHQGRR